MCRIIIVSDYTNWLKYLRFLGDMHPAEQALHGVQYFGEDIP